MIIVDLITLMEIPVENLIGSLLILKVCECRLSDTEIIS